MGRQSRLSLTGMNYGVSNPRIVAADVRRLIFLLLEEDGASLRRLLHLNN
jgi:hypothetical protein